MIKLINCRYLKSLPEDLRTAVLDPPLDKNPARMRRQAITDEEQIFCEWNIKVRKGF